MKKIYLIALLSLLVNCSNDDSEMILPSIDSISTSIANVGDIITIKGQNFNPNETYIVKFNELEGTITETKETFIKVEIPEKSTSGNITLKYSEGIINVGNITIENIFSGNITLLTQNEVDEFGSNNYTKIIGELEIGDWTNPSESVINLVSLRYLTSITGNFHIINLSNLSTLNGLDGLNYIGNHFRVQDLAKLTNLQGLEALENIGGDFVIQNDDSLLNLNGITSVTSIGGHFLIFTNDKLNNIEGLVNLKSISKDFMIESNYKLTNFNGLSNLTTINGQLDIYDHSLLSNIDGLNGLTSIGSLLIQKNDLLSNYCSLRNLISNNDLIGEYSVSENLFNPTKQDIIDGNCSN
jgi:IPT/TIG domain